MTKRVINFVSVVAMLATISCRHKEEYNPQQLDGNNMIIPAGISAMDDHMKKKMKPEEYPVIQFESMEHDFGTIKQGDKVEHIFKFTNTGKNDLFVLDVRPSCGCTAPEWTKTAVKKDDKGEIKIIFNSANKEGEQHKTIMLLTNTMQGNEILNFKANIIK